MDIDTNVIFFLKFKLKLLWKEVHHIIEVNRIPVHANFLRKVNAQTLL